jgi:5-methylcytosine-specific restriction protein A
MPTKSATHKPCNRPVEHRERAGRFSCLYRTQRWRRIRAHQLAVEPLCRICRDNGVDTPATICDHVEPHRGNMVKFWSGPFQSLCKQCHDSVKQAFEKSGKLIKKIGVDGYPIE